MSDKNKVKDQALDRSVEFIDYYKNQFKEPKRSTIALMNFVKKYVPSVNGLYSAIEVGCGGAVNIYYLSKVLTETKWTGLDIAENLLEIGRNFLPNDDKYKFIKGDFFELSKLFPPKSFDISFSIQTLTWLPRYEEAIREIMLITKKWIFVTSLFSDFNVDIYSEVFLYNVDDWCVREDAPYNYNVYSFARFRDFCIKSGAKEVISEDFVIDIDIPIPENKEEGTYTIKDINGKRLQFSGPLFMPWKMIAIRME